MRLAEGPTSKKEVISSLKRTLLGRRSPSLQSLDETFLQCRSVRLRPLALEIETLKPDVSEQHSLPILSVELFKETRRGTVVDRDPVRDAANKKFVRAIVGRPSEVLPKIERVEKVLEFHTAGLWVVGGSLQIGGLGFADAREYHAPSTDKGNRCPSVIRGGKGDRALMVTFGLSSK